MPLLTHDEKTISWRHDHGVAKYFYRHDHGVTTAKGSHQMAAFIDLSDK